MVYGKTKIVEYQKTRWQNREKQNFSFIVNRNEKQLKSNLE